MMIRRTAALAALCLLNASAWAVEYNSVDTTKSTIRFIPTLMGSKTEGSFKKFSAQIRFDPEKPAQAQARAEVMVQSFDIGFDEATDEALGPNWFDVKKFPAATFVATQVTPLTKDRFELSGNLSIKGQTKPVRFPVTLTRESANAGRLDGTLTIKRLDFGLGQGQWAGTGTVSNDVNVQIRLSIFNK